MNSLSKKMKSSANHQIVALLKSISTRENGERKGRVMAPIGKRTAFFMRGLVATIWYSKNTSYFLDGIADRIIKDKNVECIDAETIKETIIDTIYEAMDDRSIFEVTPIFTKQKQSLFDCRNGSIGVDEFANKIRLLLINNLMTKAGDFLYMTKVGKAHGPSYEIDGGKIIAINRSDRDFWSQKTRSYGTGNWDLFLGGIPNDKYKFGWYDADPGYVWLYNGCGTPKQLIEDARYALTQHVGVFYSCLRSRTGVRFFQSADRRDASGVMFPKKGSGLSMSIGGPSITPKLASEFVLTGVEIQMIKRWYDDLMLADSATKARMEKCAFFAGSAIGMRGIDNFMRNFIAIDALYGVRGAVEKTIAAGIDSLGFREFSEKINKLWNLRCELMHGGSRSIMEWPEYYAYKSHFRSEPSEDLEKIAHCALVNSHKSLGILSNMGAL